MEYLLVMSLSGSTMMVLYLLLKYPLKDKVSARLYYLILKEAVLFFLIPMPFLKGWYRKLIRTAIPRRQPKGVRIPVAWTRYVVHVGEKTYVNSYGIIQTAVVAVWLLIVCIMMVRLFLKYFRIRRLILTYEVTEMTEKQQSFLAEMKKQYGVKRPVMLCQGRNGDHTMTFGVCRPVIICGKETGSWEAEMHVRHEMVHIKRLDVLWKMLARLVLILHWWNPFAWMLRREFERICEYSCDEIVMQGRTSGEVKEYLGQLIDESCAASDKDAASMGWQNGFADDAEHIKNRIRNLSTKKKWNRYVAWMLAAVLAFANSMTVFAYRDTYHQELSENASQEEVTGALRVHDFSFTPDGADGEAIKDYGEVEEFEIIYDKQFIDTERNIYPCMDEETDTTYESCSHDFVSGALAGHTKKSDASCEIKQYHAQRCSKCGYVVRGERIAVYTYEVCPH
ncbi:MAG: M56 family metallopeptidase [Lachnospiraceae bacterium]|nr:M56 family metallopeptidase [Lachnospiraceae bacterium]